MGANDTNAGAYGGGGRYGLEEHLESFRETDPRCRMLAACWGVEKPQYEKALKTVPQAYPHYSMHDASHSACIVSSIELILGTDRIKLLSATDTWLILEAAYTHDIGMTKPTADGLLEQLTNMKKSEYQRWVRGIYEDGGEVADALMRIEPIIEYRREANDRKKAQKRGIPHSMEMGLRFSGALSEQLNHFYEQGKKDEKIGLPSRMIEEFALLSEALARPKHHIESNTILADDAHAKTYSEIIPLYLRLLVGEIARLHGETKDKILRDLPQVSVGFCGDYAHPRFVTELLRIGDLLDLNSDRFNQLQLDAIGNSSIDSLAHYAKHMAVRHLLISPQIVEVSANFETDRIWQLLKRSGLGQRSDGSVKARLINRACKALSGWLKMLKEELVFFSARWQEIIPKDMTGAAPSYKEASIMIDGIEVSEDIINLCYSIGMQRAAEIIEGAGLYKEPQLVFLREVIQNALDATKYQIFRDIQSGAFPKLFDPAAGNNDVESNISEISFIDFCEAVSERELRRYTIDISISNTQDTLLIKVRDRGIGISYKQIQKMRRIGDTHNADLADEYEQMPPWLRPTGSYGVGMQTIFRVTQVFQVQSCARREHGNQKHIHREIFFYSTKVGGEILITNTESNALRDHQFGFGTEVSVEIPKDKLRDILADPYTKEYDPYQEPVDAARAIIKRYCDRMFCCVGIPVIILPMDMDSDKKNEAYDRAGIVAGLGQYVITLPDKKIKKMDYFDTVRKTEAPSGKAMERGFSVWNQDYGVLIKYNTPKTPDSRYTGQRKMSVYFKGILVPDIDLPKMTSIPFWDLEIHLMGLEARNVLQVNRDAFLPEVLPDIAELIRKTHLCFMSMLENDNEKHFDDFIDYLLYHCGKEACESKSCSCKEGGICAYLRHALLYNSTLYALYDGLEEAKLSAKIIKSINTNHPYSSGGLRYYENRDYEINEGILIPRSDAYGVTPCERFAAKKPACIWFYDDKLNGLQYFTNYHGFGKFSDPAIIAPCGYLMTDLYGKFSEFAIFRAYTLGLYGWNQGSVVVYQVKARNGTSVDMPEEDYWHFVMETTHYAATSSTSSLKDKRLVFPGHQLYESISVTRLPRGLESGDNQKWNSWLISPFTIKTLQNWFEQFKQKWFMAQAGKKNQKSEDFIGSTIVERFIDENKGLIASLTATTKKELFNHILQFSVVLNNPSRCAPLMETEINKQYTLWLKRFASNFDWGVFDTVKQKPAKYVE